MRRSRQVASAASIVMGTVAAILVNLLTDGGGWPIAAALAVTTASWVALDVVLSRRTSAPTRVRQTADRSQIRGSRIRASAGSDVREAARGGSRIENSSISASGADVERRADHEAAIV